MYFLCCLVLFPYFLCTSFEEHNKKYHPSTFWFNFLPFVAEFAAICSLIAICAYYLKYCEHSYFVIPFILLFIGFAFILTLDLIRHVAEAISYDLAIWLRNDLHDRRIPIASDSRYAPYIAHFAKDNTYLLHNRRDKITDCHICLEAFDEEPEAERVILRCGHVYHSQCIDSWEQSKWTQDQFAHPFLYCPECRISYHAELEKFEYDENYKPYSSFKLSGYPGKELLREMFWIGQVDRYIKYKKEYRAAHLV